MEYRARIILLILILQIVFSGCEEVDFTGMFFPEESANERFDDSKAWNDLNPIPAILVPTDNYFILSASDIHAGTTYNLDKFNSIARSIRPAALVLAGDLTWGKREGYEVFQKHLLHKDTLTTFLMAGNHDCNFDGWSEYRTRFGSSTYFFKILTPVAIDLFICLETAGATLGSKQLDWLNNVLENERPGCRRCIIFTHTNFFRFDFSEASNPQTEEIVAILELIIRNKIDMVIAGHSHIQDELKFGNTTYIVMPPLKDEHPKAGFFRLDVREGKLEYSFVHL